jgi:hypothetical protein
MQNMPADGDELNDGEGAPKVFTVCPDKPIRNHLFQGGAYK